MKVGRVIRYKSVILTTLVGLLCSALLLRYLHYSLIVDDPQASDLIVVPSGDFLLRTSKAVELAKEGFAGRIVVDEGTDTLTFGRTLARHRQDQVGEFAVPITICPTRGETTFGESHDARVCLMASHPHRILIVTSDFHTRRSLAIFRRALPEVSFSVSAVPTSYSTEPWWHAESIGTTLEEWVAIGWSRIRN